MDGPSLGSMAAIDDEVAGAAIGDSVRDFYERHPYPLPVSDLTGYGPAWDHQRRRADSHLLWPDLSYRENRKILVAGCGTSQAAKYALRWPQAHVTGIDFSASSIAETAKLKRKHSIHNLDLHQLPLERASDLGLSFDHIVCTGVLHHLPDPVAGLRALRDVLSSEGAMHLMVYAPFGRVGIYMLQEYCRRLGIGTSADEIRDLAANISALPPDHPLMPLLRSVADFQNAAGLADALLNPRDRSYSVPELFELLAEAELEFGRWLRQAPYLPSCGALAVSPHHERCMRLPLPDQFATVELFRGSISAHSFVACRNGRGRHHAPDFEGRTLVDFVPVRVPDTVVVEEGLPATAAAVLINRNHTFRDIYLPINSPQKALFDSIDGWRSIRELVADKEALPAARTLFERLWNYDHVVFDTSGAS